MPRTARASQAGYCYHLLNRGNGRRTVFHKDGDDAAFGKVGAGPAVLPGPPVAVTCGDA